MKIEQDQLLFFSKREWSDKMEKISFTTGIYNYKLAGLLEWSNDKKLFLNYMDAVEKYKYDRKKSLSEFRYLLRREPEFFPIINSIGKHYLNSKKYDKAIQYYIRAFEIVMHKIPINFKGHLPWDIELNRYFISTLNGLVLSYWYSNQIDKSLLVLKKIVQYDPEGHLMNKYRRGTIFYINGDYSEAEKIFENINAFPPYNYLYGRYLFNSGKYQEAILQLCLGMMRDNYICEKIIHCVYDVNIPNKAIYKKLSREFIKFTLYLFRDAKFRNFLRQIYRSKAFKEYLNPYQNVIAIYEYARPNEKKYEDIRQLIRMFKTVFNDIYAEKVYHEISDKIKKFCVNNV